MKKKSIYQEPKMENITFSPLYDLCTDASGRGTTDDVGPWDNVPLS